jgi:hypothetical protein
MFGPIPTKGGDVVISYSGGVASDYCVWLVDNDGQQRPEGASGSIRVETRAEADDTAHEIASDTHGRIFIADDDTGEWDRLLSHV